MTHLVFQVRQPSFRLSHSAFQMPNPLPILFEK
jgi:hypothetical protein